MLLVLWAIALATATYASFLQAAGTDWPAPSLVLCQALLVAATGLAALWCGLSPAQPVARLSLMAGAILVAGRTLDVLSRTWGQWSCMLGVQCLLVVCVALVLRHGLGLRLCRSAPAVASPVGAGRLQFDLATGLSGVAGLAVVCCLVRWEMLDVIYPRFHLGFMPIEPHIDWRVIERASTLGAIHATAVLLALWAVYGRGPASVRVAGLLAGGAALAVALPWVMSIRTRHLHFVLHSSYFLLLLGEALVVAGSLAVFRLCGWRLARPWRQESAER